MQAKHTRKHSGQPASERVQVGRGTAGGDQVRRKVRSGTDVSSHKEKEEFTQKRSTDLVLNESGILWS